jgi:hypothetical protein
MWNGERTPVEENLARVLRDGDELYLLGPSRRRLKRRDRFALPRYEE